MTARMTESETQATPRAAPEDPVAKTILALVGALAPGKSIAPETVARALAEARAQGNKTPDDPPDAWRRALPQVKQQALHLARRGRIVILRKGKPVDPHAPVKGVIRLAAAARGEG